MGQTETLYTVTTDGVQTFTSDMGYRSDAIVDMILAHLKHLDDHARGASCWQRQEIWKLRKTCISTTIGE